LNKLPSIEQSSSLCPPPDLQYYEVLEKKIDEFGLPVTPPQFLAAAIGGLLVVLFLLSVIFRGKKSGNSFLFVGLCGSGKTALMCLVPSHLIIHLFLSCAGLCLAAL
jgi:hypothetical protein